MPTLLSVNNYHYPRGGADVVFLEHNRLLESARWDVVPFAMSHPNNLPTPWSEYFAEEVEFGHTYSTFQKLRKIPKTVYSFEARNKIRQLVDKTSPNVAHCHNIYHHLSPSILHELKSLGVPCVMTLHDLKIACPAYKMLTHDGICERCKGGAFRNVVIHRCIKKSTALSALVWFESQLHRFLNTYSDCVDSFFVPSNFHIEKFVEWGWPRDKFQLLPNFVDSRQLIPEYRPNDNFVYFGRLSEEKGLETLIKAVAKSGVKLSIAGQGPIEDELRTIASELGARVDFVGFLNGEKLHEFVRQARAVVLPSECYENAPLSLMEAYALGKSVIGSNIGGIPELIRVGETGEVFEAGSVEGLVQCLVKYSALSDTEIEARGRAGRQWMISDYSHNVYLERVLQLYSAYGVHEPTTRPDSNVAINTMRKRNDPRSAWYGTHGGSSKPVLLKACDVENIEAANVGGNSI